MKYNRKPLYLSEDEEFGYSDMGPLLQRPSHEDKMQLLNENKPKLWPQFLATLCATLGAFSIGTVLGYSSPAGAVLTSNSTDISFRLTESQNSWFSSICNLGALFGSLLGGISVNKLGRRGTMIHSFTPFTIGWILIIAAVDFVMLILGRLLTGFSVGLISMAVPTYIAEFASPHIRGTLGCGFQLMIVSGVLFAFCTGVMFSNFRYMAGICAVFPCIFAALMFFMPESPHYLLSVKKKSEAVEAMKFFRGREYKETEIELDKMEDHIEESRKTKITMTDLRSFHIIMPIFISLSLFIFQQFSGITAILFNMELIFKSAGSNMSSTISAIVVATMKVPATLVGVLLADKAGRKILLAVSAFMMAVSLAILGTYFYLKEKNPETIGNLDFLPIVCLSVFTIAFSIGYGPIPWVIMAELFSPEIKEVASSMATVTNWTMAFLTTVIFSSLQNALGNYGVYWMFSGCCILSFIFVIFCVVETKGKTLQEINTHFRRNRLYTEQL